MSSSLPLADAAAGCILGTAVGDALGLAAEGLSRKRQQAIFPALDSYHFFLGKGFCSDDTEHACMTANALISASRRPDRILDSFRSSLAWRLRFWLLGLPAGVGLATGRGIIKLWLGFPAANSGVFSAGNGPAMRSPVIGVLYGNKPELMKELARASTRLTHTDPKAEHAAFAVALAAHYAASGRDFDATSFLEQMRQCFGDSANETIAAISGAFASVDRGEITGAFAESIGCGKGVSGYALHTVPVCLHAWLSHRGDFRSTVLAVIRCGGDSDTTAAIAGGIAGAEAGKAGIPAEWLENLWEWPRTVSWMERLGRAAALSTAGKDSGVVNSPGLFAPALLARNILFLVVVLLHGFRRLLPPYG